MVEEPESPKLGVGQSTRHVLGVTQEFFRFFTAGAMIYEMHRLFLRYYAGEWLDVQFNGPNRCAGVAMIANGDLWNGDTFCNGILNYLPWLVLYRDHLGAAIAYYGTAGAVVTAVAWFWRQRHGDRLRRSQRDVEQAKALGDSDFVPKDTLATRMAGRRRRS